MNVIDVSAAIAQAVLSQASEAFDAFFARVAPPYVTHPLFVLELRNAVRKLERCKIIDADESDLAIGLIESGVEFRAWGNQSAEMAQILSVARKENLSFYVASYLDLAEREGVGLVTRDGPLLEAAHRRGVPVHDLR